MAALPDGSVQVFAQVTRVAQLDPAGFIAPGTPVYTTSSLIKATFTPNLETGVDLAQVNANGDLVAHYKHGDMPKYYEAVIQVADNDPILSALLVGGTILTDSSTALTAATTPTLTALTAGGLLATGTFGYKIASYNGYGETAAGTETTVAVTGPTGAVWVQLPTPTGVQPLGQVVFGRTVGGEQKMVKVPWFFGQTTSAATGTGALTVLPVTTLTQPIPQGGQFQITGDTNTPKITFTCTSAAGIGATAVAVTTSPATITTTIAAGAINPGILDTGFIVPSGRPPTVDSSAGPGNDVGLQAPALGVVGNPYGCSIEMWASMTLNGTQAAYLPYNRWVFPGVRNLREDARTFGPELQLPTYNGQAFENPSWGSGPMKDWQFDSSKVWQRARAGVDTVPSVGVATASM